MDSVEFSDVLAEYVKQAGYSLSQMAQLSGLAKSTIANWLEGKVKGVRRWQDLIKLAAALRLSAQESNKLLEASGHPSIEKLGAIAVASENNQMITLLDGINERRGIAKAERGQFGDLLTQYVKRVNHTTSELARVTGIPIPTINHWLAGDVDKPHSWQDITKLATALELSTKETNRLLRAGRHPSIEQLLTIAGTNQDETMLKVLLAWDNGSDQVAALPIRRPTLKKNRTRFNPQSIPKFPKPFLKQVREACHHYDKPKRIGKLPLATVALQLILLEQPDHATDLIGRAHALQSVIDLNIEKLKQTEELYYLCLYCYIYHRDPRSGTSIWHIGRYLEVNYSIPKPTYHNWISTKCLPLLSYHISQYLAQHAWVEATPYTSNFVGREAQLVYYRQQLEQNGLTVIQGVGGIGKTVLAAKLVESIKKEHKRPVCWITIRAGLNDSVSGMLYGWGAFLAKEGYPQLWAFMRGTANEEKKVTDFFPHLLIGFDQIAPVLCLDNLEVIANSQEDVWTLLSMVQEKSQAALLLTSQRRPPLAALNGYLKLSGLTPNEVQELITPQQIELTDEQIKALTRYSNGNPRLINLWIAHLRLQGFDRADLSPTESEVTSDFLLSQIINALSEGQQRAALLLALSRRPLDRFLLQSSPKQLRPLSDLEIDAYDFTALQRVGIISAESANQWTMLPLLKEHLAQEGPILPFADELIDFHQWLADLYLLQANVMDAAYHATQGGQAERALLWLTRQQHQLIEQGQAMPMNALLRAIPADELSGPRKRLLHELRIDLSQLLGDYEATEREIKVAQESSLNTDDDAYLKRMEGELAKQRGHVQQASDHYQEALQLLNTKRKMLETLLHSDLAWVLMQQNDLDEASNEVQRARIVLENVSGSIARRQGKLDLAISHFEQAIVHGKELGEHRQLIRVYNNLALSYWAKEKFLEAITTFERNLELIENIGELVGKAITLLNIGRCYTQIGLDEPEKAISYFAQALPIFMTLGDSTGQMLAQIHLAEQHLRIGQLNKAEQHVQAAMSIDQMEVSTFTYIEAQRIYAEVLLAQGKLMMALTVAQEALDSLRAPNAIGDGPDSLNDPFYAKLVAETLIKVHEALGNRAEAERYRALAVALGERIR